MTSRAFGLACIALAATLGSCTSSGGSSGSGGSGGNTGGAGGSAAGSGGATGGTGGTAATGGATGGTGGTAATGGTGGTAATGGTGGSGGAAGGGGSAGVTATFDFDTGTPTLSTGQSVPLDQTSNGVTAHVSSPQGAAFSVQTDSSTGWKMSQFSGHYLMDNNLDKNALDIQLDHPSVSITLVFATADFNQTEVPTDLQLTAYNGSTSTTPVGSATTHGSYAGDTMPMGTLSFSSAVPFDLVELSIPYQPLGASDFLVDNVTVVTK